ncbi:MAG: hypothetical protein WCN95_04555 [bacterium]
MNEPVVILLVDDEEAHAALVPLHDDRSVHQSPLQLGQSVATIVAMRVAVEQ